jgi:lambda family phage tail tape measure protein
MRPFGAFLNSGPSMTTDSRKLQLETGVDSTGAKQGFQEIKDSAKDMAQAVSKAGQEAAKGVDGIGAGAPEAAQKVDRATSNLVSSIQRATAAAEAGKKSGSAFFESLAGQRGADMDVLKPYLSQLDTALAKQKAVTASAIDLSKATTSLGASSYVKPLGNPTTSLGATGFGTTLATEAQKAQVSASQSLDKIGISAKQTQAALRGVPAQFTDIVTSLQGGQAPLTVLLQQGGQLKDMFGGIGPAAKALGGYIGGLINPFTLAAGAVALLGVAFYSATERAQAFNKALITSGNYVGKSASDLDDLSKSISGTIGTQGQAADALTALAGSGKIAGDSLRTVGEAVVAQNKAMGTSIEEAVGQFVKLGEEPTKASAKLNESLHYLNQTTYDRIRALEDQGDKEAAAALAQDSYAKATVDRMNQVINQSGLLSRALSGTKDVAMGMWNAVAGGLASIGAAQSAADKLIDAQRKVAYLKQNGSSPAALAAAQGDVTSLSRAALRDQDNAYAQGQRARDEAAKISASDRLNTLTKEVQTNADKRKKAIADLNRDFQTLGKTTSGPEYDKLVANINDKFKDPKEAKGPREKAFQDDAATKMLESLRQQEATLKEQLSTDEKLTASEKERAKFVQLVADLKGKKQLTAEQQSLLTNQGAIKAQLDQNVAIEKQVEAKKEAARLDAQAKQNAEELARTFNGINLAMESANESRRDQYERTLATVGLGRRARSEVESEFGLRKDEQRSIRQATKAASDKGLLDSDAYKDEVAKIHESAEDARKDLQDFYAKDKANRENWVNGAREAFSNYADYASDAASHTEEVFGNALKGIEDQLTNLFTGKKFDAKKLLEDTGADVARSAVKEFMTGPLAKFGGDLLGDGGAISGLLGGGKKMGNERGSSASNPLFVRSADSFGAAANASTFGASGNTGSGLASAIGSIFGGFSNGTATTVANALPGDALDNLIKLQGGWGSVAGFAGGGDPPVGRISMVGERGPELFVPKQAGTIVPNDALGGGTVVHINQTFAEGTTRKTADMAALQASRAIQRAQRNA